MHFCTSCDLLSFIRLFSNPVVRNVSVILSSSPKFLLVHGTGVLDRAWVFRIPAFEFMFGL